MGRGRRILKHLVDVSMAGVVVSGLTFFVLAALSGIGERFAGRASVIATSMLSCGFMGAGMALSALFAGHVPAGRSWFGRVHPLGADGLRQVRRDREPFGYWLRVAVYAALAAGGLTMATLALLGIDL